MLRTHWMDALRGLVLGGVCLLGSGCAAGPGVLAVGEAGAVGGAGVTRGPALASVTVEPGIRVRIVKGAAEVLVSGDGALGLRAPGADGRWAGLSLRSPVRFSRTAGVWTMRGAGGVVREYRGARVVVDVPRSGLTMVGDARYAGQVELRASSASADGLDVVNTLGLEAYLPGVLQRELFSDWEPAAFEAQAIAARSYALWEMKRSRLRGRAFDLESTTASQAYAGVAENPRARAGVVATRGVVLAYRGRVLPAFYSSSHGPMGADGGVTFAGRVEDLPPLRGAAHGRWDALSPRFNWQASRDAADLAARLQAWGRSKGHAVAQLVSPVRQVMVTERNAVGRHEGYAVIGAAGRRYEIGADDLRHAANFETAGSPEPSRDQRVYSGQFVPVVHGGVVAFTQGHGHGHGVGMSQYGAQGRALQGQTHEAILRAYYPGASLVRLY